MRVECCLDSNVLLYALSKSPEDQLRRDRALKLLALPGIGFPLQVLQEFYHVARRKARLGIAESDAEVLISALQRKPIQVTTVEVFQRARWIAARYGLSYWDAAVVAASEALGAAVLYSEDMGHGQVYGNVMVENPFHFATS